MRRADRLFRIVQMLRSGRLKTARALAERLQVSERTIYRDVRDLQLAGQPIEGEAGVGYTLRRDFDLPPLMFTPEELTALVLGARLVKAWGGAENVAAANSALARIEAVLPPELASRLDAIALYAPGFKMTMSQRKLLDALHKGCLNRTVLAFRYTRLGEDESRGEHRTVRPLALTFWSGVWTLAAWCEMRNDFRTFRIDRIAEFVATDRIFTSQRGQRLEDLMKKLRAEPKWQEATRSRLE
ncbi:WYL domain-containing protein [Granulicella sp. 5B5]|uniref:helix-turn-helix transcriptional regulator n=1 Tax=Granulicella sp. 5B5 TaxID=1617967 RepID=UPI0015F60958|nr:YafY family protein [Granulicella sp. 5B5]QMV18489.1 WYL domain-containing protein [Granulicella sp. 5B5]